RNEERRRDRRLRTRRREEAYLHERLALDRLEEHREDILEPELSCGIATARAAGKGLGRGPLLGEPHRDLIAEGDVEAAGRRQPVVELVAHRLEEVVLDAPLEREEREPDLVGTGAHPVRRPHVAPLERRDRQAVLDLADRGAAESLLDVTEQLPRPRVADLPPLAIDGERQPDPDALRPADSEGDGL